MQLSITASVQQRQSGIAVLVIDMTGKRVINITYVCAIHASLYNLYECSLSTVTPNAINQLLVAEMDDVEARDKGVHYASRLRQQRSTYSGLASLQPNIRVSFHCPPTAVLRKPPKH